MRLLCLICGLMNWLQTQSSGRCALARGSSLSKARSPRPESFSGRTVPTTLYPRSDEVIIRRADCSLAPQKAAKESVTDRVAADWLGTALIKGTATEASIRSPLSKP